MFNWNNKSKTPRMEKVRPGPPRFLCEQDGGAERELKSLLLDFFERNAFVRVAYLARVRYGDEETAHVALCVRGQPGQERIFAQHVGRIFASLFNRDEHLDTLWITGEQEKALQSVCQPFYSIDASTSS